MKSEKRRVKFFHRHECKTLVLSSFSIYYQMFRLKQSMLLIYYSLLFRLIREHFLLNKNLYQKKYAFPHSRSSSFSCMADAERKFRLKIVRDSMAEFAFLSSISKEISVQRSRSKFCKAFRYNRSEKWD